MGQKVHSIGLRLGTNRKWKSSWFCDLNNYGKFLHQNLQIEKFIKTFLLLQPKKSILVDCKILKSSNETLYIFVWFYRYRKSSQMNLPTRRQKTITETETKFKRKHIFPMPNSIISNKSSDNSGINAKGSKQSQLKNSNGLSNIFQRKFETNIDTNSLSINLAQMNPDIIQNKINLLRKKLHFLQFWLKQNQINNSYISWRKLKLILNKININWLNIFFYNQIWLNWNKLKLSDSKNGLWNQIVRRYKKKLVLNQVIKKNKSLQNYYFRLKTSSYKQYRGKFINLQSVKSIKKIHRDIIKMFCFKNSYNNKKFLLNKDFINIYKTLFKYQVNQRSELQKLFQNKLNSNNNLINLQKNYSIPRTKLLKQNFKGSLQNVNRVKSNIKIINGNQFLFLDKFYFNLILRKNLNNFNLPEITSFKFNNLPGEFKKALFFTDNFLLNPKSLQIFLTLYQKNFREYIWNKLSLHIKFLYTAFINYNEKLCSKENWYKFLNFYVQENLKQIDFKPVFYNLEENKKVLYKYLLQKTKLNIWNYLYFYHFQKKWFCQNYLNSINNSNTKQISFTNDIWNFKTSNKLQNTLLKKKLFIWQELKKNHQAISGVLNIWKNYKKTYLNSFFSKIKKKFSPGTFNKRQKTFYKQYVLRNLYKNLTKSRRNALVNLHQFLFLTQNSTIFNDFTQKSEFSISHSDLLKQLQLLIPFNKKQLRQVKRLFFISYKKRERFINILKSWANDRTTQLINVNKHVEQFLSKKERKKYVLKQLGSLMTIQTLQKNLHILTKLNIKLIFINSLSFTNFQYYYTLKNSSNQIKQKSIINQRFKNLEKITKNFMRRWRKMSFWTSDLVNISIISMFLKNTDLLANFIAYQISFLPKNRKQTAFLKFLTKVIFNFKGERKEIIGFKMRFKGRFNRWSRTKKWVANVGNLWFQTYNVCLNYSYHKGIVKKGVFSTQIWLQYKKEFVNVLKTNSLTYFNYSKIKNFKKKLQ